MPDNPDNKDKEGKEVDVEVKIPESLLKDLDRLVELKPSKYPNREAALVAAIKDLISTDKELFKKKGKED